MKKISGKAKNGASLLEAINQNNSLIVTAFCFLLGFLAGVLIFKAKSSAEGYYSGEFSDIYNNLRKGFLSASVHSFLNQLPFAAAIFLSGTCMVGVILVPLVTAVCGASYGIMMAYLYFAYSLKGIVFNLLIIVPSAVITAIAVILSSREALGFSLSLARLAFPDVKKPHLEQDFKLYSIRQFFVLLFFLAAALTEGFMASSFISFFELT